MENPELPEILALLSLSSNQVKQPCCEEKIDHL